VSAGYNLSPRFYGIGRWRLGCLGRKLVLWKKHNRFAVGMCRVDESLPIGQCLGLMPKMRLPLPLDCGAAFAEYIEAFSELQDDEAAYLRLGDQEAAGFGDEAPIIALIDLDRQDSGSTSFEEASRPALVKSLLSQVYAPHLDISKLVPSMNRLASLVPCFTLRFSNSREAAQVIATRFREPSKNAGDD
jgi:hypothetical protein